LILSTHLARSYHHLFPLQNWTEVSWRRASQSDQHACFGCQTPFPTKRKFPNAGTSTSTSKDKKTSVSGASSASASTKQIAEGVSESGRYECGTCHRFFCIDCDVFAHEIAHNCPGCQSREGFLQAEKEDAEKQDMGTSNGNDELYGI
jgi:transcription initiation factor TFIIH subunit 2